MSDKIVKQHDPNCSFLKVDIETDPTMRSSYGCDCGLHSVADEVTMGDAWRSGPEDFSKAIEEQIEKYREMFPDSPIHVLGTVIPPLNTEKAEPFSESKLHETFDGPEITEGAEPSIKLTFYSGKLWNSDKRMTAHCYQ